MSELAIKVARTRNGRLADHLVWSALASWRETGRLPPGFELRRGNYGRPVGPRAWLRYVARVKETWRPGIVLCDFDTPEAPSRTTIAVRLWKARLKASWVRYDRTARGWHVVIQLRQSLTLAETVALQAVLGSDPHREAFNLGRAIGLRRRPSSFWESRANVLYGGKLTWEAKMALERRRESKRNGSGRNSSHSEKGTTARNRDRLRGSSVTKAPRIKSPKTKANRQPSSR